MHDSLYHDIAGPPAPMRECDLSSPRSKGGGLSVLCRPGWTGGLETNYTMQVDTRNITSPAMTQRLADSLGKVANESQDLVFYVEDILDHHDYIFTIFAENPQGRSDSVTYHYKSDYLAAGLPMSETITDDVNAAFLSQLKMIMIQTLSVMVVIIIVATVSMITNIRSKKKGSTYKKISRPWNYRNPPPEGPKQTELQRSYVHFRNGK